MRTTSHRAAPSYRGRGWLAATAMLAGAGVITAVGPVGHARADGGWTTRGSAVIAPSGAQYRISGVNWYGFETTDHLPHGLWSQDYKTIVNRIAANGYNSIRMPFSDELVRKNPRPTVPQSSPSGPINTDLAGLTSLQIMDKVVNYAGSKGLHVILDNHRSAAGSGADAGGLWYGSGYSTVDWVRDWTTLATRYRNNPAVIGFDLRNEPHSTGSNGSGGATWGSGDPTTDWRLAAERAGNAVLNAAPGKLVFVEGVSNYGNEATWWGGNLLGAKKYPVRLNTPGKLVYSAHEYGPAEFPQSWLNQSTTPRSLDNHFRHFWGYLAEQNTAPVWIGEWGTPQDNRSISDRTPGSQGQWFQALVSYLNVHPNIGWSYWAVNGEDRYGLLTKTYGADANATSRTVLAGIANRPSSIGPGKPAATAPRPKKAAPAPRPVPRTSARTESTTLRPPAATAPKPPAPKKPAPKLHKPVLRKPVLRKPARPASAAPQSSIVVLGTPSAADNPDGWDGVLRAPGMTAQQRSHALWAAAREHLRVILRAFGG